MHALACGFVRSPNPYIYLYTHDSIMRVLLLFAFLHVIAPWLFVDYHPMLQISSSMRRIQAICGQVAASSSITVAPTTTPIIFPTVSSSSTTVGGPVGRVHANRVAIVTGGASGIGEATVLAFVAQGASVAIFDVNVTAGRALAAKLTSQGHKVNFYEVDVSDSARCKAATEQWAAVNGGKIHALVNNGTSSIDAPCIIGNSPRECVCHVCSCVFRIERYGCDERRLGPIVWCERAGLFQYGASMLPILHRRWWYALHSFVAPVLLLLLV